MLALSHALQIRKMMLLVNCMYQLVSSITLPSELFHNILTFAFVMIFQEEEEVIQGFRKGIVCISAGNLSVQAQEHIPCSTKEVSFGVGQYSHKDPRHGGQRDMSDVKSTCGSCRESEFGSEHPHRGTHSLWISSSKTSLFWLCGYLQAHSCSQIHT